MVDPSQNAVLIINTNNNIIPDLKDGVFNFMEPKKNVTNYLNLFDTENVNIVVSDNKISLKEGKQKADMYFCSDSFVSTFGGDDSGINVEFFHEMKIDEDISVMLKKIQKIGGAFGKVYFGVENNKFFMESADKSNRFSNGLKFNIDDVKKANLECYYDYKYFNAILSVIDDNIPDFTMKFAYIDDQNAGMILFENTDGSEKYYLMSRVDG